MTDEIERVKMCVAEAGYDPSYIEDTEPILKEHGYFFTNLFGIVPLDVCWKAREVSELGDPKCFNCTVNQIDSTPTNIIENKCRAVRRLELNCGAYDDKENE